jgi:hypothetical protein
MSMSNGMMVLYRNVFSFHASYYLERTSTVSEFGKFIIILYSCLTCLLDRYMFHSEDLLV